MGTRGPRDVNVVKTSGGGGAASGGEGVSEGGRREGSSLRLC